jgi:hypothetical protein
MAAVHDLAVSKTHALDAAMLTARMNANGSWVLRLDYGMPAA